MDASLALLPRGGRFIEMGKTDIRDADEVAAQHAGVSYRAFDLLEAGPERLEEMLLEVLGLFQRARSSICRSQPWTCATAKRLSGFCGRQDTQARSC